MKNIPLKWTKHAKNHTLGVQAYVFSMKGFPPLSLILGGASGIEW